MSTASCDASIAGTCETAPTLKRVRGTCMQACKPRMLDSPVTPVRLIYVAFVGSASSTRPYLMWLIFCATGFAGATEQTIIVASLPKALSAH